MVAWLDIAVHGCFSQIIILSTEFFYFFLLCCIYCATNKKKKWYAQKKRKIFALLCTVSRYPPYKLVSIITTNLSTDFLKIAFFFFRSRQIYHVHIKMESDIRNTVYIVNYHLVSFPPPRKKKYNMSLNKFKHECCL